MWSSVMMPLLEVDRFNGPILLLKRGQVFHRGHIYIYSVYFSPLFHSTSRRLLMVRKIQSVLARKENNKKRDIVGRILKSFGPCAPYPFGQPNKQKRHSRLLCSPDETDYRCNKWHVIFSFSTASKVLKMILKNMTIPAVKMNSINYTNVMIYDFNIIFLKNRLW